MYRGNNRAVLGEEGRKTKGGTRGNVCKLLSARRDIYNYIVLNVHFTLSTQ